tara:strand:- start:2541 stop:4784 length:2244 start_codon:yes stop_codon:yes gene_type:complete
MSVLSRKMFNNPNGRDARNKLKGMGGIMASSPELANMVQGYSDGDQIRVPKSGPLGGINEFTEFVNYVNQLPSRLRENINFDDYQLQYKDGLPVGIEPRAKDGKVLRSGEEVLDSTVPRISQEEIDRIISATDELNQNRGPGNLFDLPEARTNIGEAFYNIIETFGSIPGAIAQGAFLLTEQGLKLNPEFVAGIQSGDIPLPKGFDLAKFEEFQDETTGRPPGMVEGKIVNIGDEDALSILEARRPYKEPLVRMAETASEELSRQRGLDADAARKTAEALALTRQPYKEPLVRMAEEKKKEKVEDEAVQRGLDADAARKTKEALSYIAKEVSDDAGLGTTTTEKSDSLQSFIDEFNKYKPDYEGPDKGMILAKIGFAMAAGKDPNALVNIANAFGQGADMLIKDKAKRDEFNRQVDLAALQYGIGEVSKIRQEDRLEARTIAKERRGFEKFTFGAEGGVYRGKKYGPFEDVAIMVGDIQDNKMPTGLISSSTVTALNKKGSSMTGLIEDLVKQKVISEDGGRKDIEAYTKASSNAIRTERAIGIAEKLMLNIGTEGVVGIAPVVKEIYERGASLLGKKKEYTSIEQARNGFRALLQEVIPITLGDAQSANSISNKDVDYLIQAYFGPKALEDLTFNFIFESEGAMIERLQRATAAMRADQKKNFTIMTGIEQRLQPLFKRGTLTVDESGAVSGVSALELLNPARQALLDANLIIEGQDDIGLNVGASIGYTRDPDTGIYRFKQPKGN